jgi:hypothetical protein
LQPQPVYPDGPPDASAETAAPTPAADVNSSAPDSQPQPVYPEGPPE